MRYQWRTSWPALTRSSSTPSTLMSTARPKPLSSVAWPMWTLARTTAFFAISDFPCDFATAWIAPRRQPGPTPKKKENREKQTNSERIREHAKGGRSKNQPHQNSPSQKVVLGSRPFRFRPSLLERRDWTWVRYIQRVRRGLRLLQSLWRYTEGKIWSAETCIKFLRIFNYLDLLHSDYSSRGFVVPCCPTSHATDRRSEYGRSGGQHDDWSRLTKRFTEKLSINTILPAQMANFTTCTVSKGHLRFPSHILTWRS